MKTLLQKKAVKMLGTFALGAAVSVTGLPAQAQELNGKIEEKMSTDRPDETEGADTVPRGRIQIESGYRVDRQGDEKETSFGEALMRVGVSDRAELRFEVPNYLRIRDEDGKHSGFDDITLGAKIRLTPDDAATQISIIPEATLPTGARKVAARKFQPGVALAFAFPDIGKMEVESNLGYTYAHDGEERFNRWFASLSFGYDITEKLGTYLEGYVYSKDESDGGSRKFVNTGLMYKMKPHTQIDAYVGKGVSNHVRGRDYFYGFGIAQRF